MRGRIPNSESKASWTIKQKSEHPESAQLHASTYVEPKDWVGSKNKCEDWCIRVAQRGFTEDTFTGRKPGSRVEGNEETGFYVVNN
jgi:hypothetical protein